MLVAVAVIGESVGKYFRWCKFPEPRYLQTGFISIDQLSQIVWAISETSFSSYFFKFEYQFINASINCLYVRIPLIDSD